MLPIVQCQDNILITSLPKYCFQNWTCYITNNNGPNTPVPALKSLIFNKPTYCNNIDNVGTDIAATDIAATDIAATDIAATDIAATRVCVYGVWGNMHRVGHDPLLEEGKM